MIRVDESPIRGFFSAGYEPVASVEPGGSVELQALNAAWRWEPGEDEWPSPEGAGHPLAGPIEVRGAQGGGTLAIRIEEVAPRPWGENWGDGEHVEWRLDGDLWRSGAFAVRARPFLGVIGMPPPEPGEHPTGPPRRFGGNVDCRELVAGTTLYLPIPVDGALVLAGDGHGAQGDGEVSGTAVECPLERARLGFDLVDLELRSPLARTDDAWLAFGFDEDLDAAAREATETMLDLIQREHGVSRKRALALASVAVDLRVTQIVNGVKGVHAVLRDDAMR